MSLSDDLNRNFIESDEQYNNMCNQIMIEQNKLSNHNINMPTDFSSIIKLMNKSRAINEYTRDQEIILFNILNEMDDLKPYLKLFGDKGVFLMNHPKHINLIIYVRPNYNFFEEPEKNIYELIGCGDIDYFKRLMNDKLIDEIIRLIN